MADQLDNKTVLAILDRVFKRFLQEVGQSELVWLPDVLLVENKPIADCYDILAFMEQAGYITVTSGKGVFKEVQPNSPETIRVGYKINIAEDIFSRLQSLIKDGPLE